MRLHLYVANVCVPQHGSVCVHIGVWDRVRECVCVGGGGVLWPMMLGLRQAKEAVGVCLVGCKTLEEIHCRMTISSF